jgi:hypothetical protein
MKRFPEEGQIDRMQASPVFCISKIHREAIIFSNVDKGFFLFIPALPGLSKEQKPEILLLLPKCQPEQDP